MNTSDRRYRHKGVRYDGHDFTWSSRVKYRADGSVSGPWYGSTHCFGQYSELGYFITPGFYSGRLNSNPCDHAAIDAYIKAFSGTVSAHWFGNVVDIEYANVHPQITPNDLLSRFSPTINSLFLHREAVKFWTEVSTPIRSSISAVNFLYELKDFGSILKKLGDIPKRLSSFYVNGPQKYARTKDFLNPRAQSAPDRAKDFAKLFSENFLNYSFNWAPLVSDLKKATEMIDSISKRLEWLRRTAGKPTTVTKYVDFTKELGLPASFTGPASDGRSFAAVNSKDSKAILHFQCKMDHSLDANIAANSWAAIFAGYGSNNPLKIGWNAIPFSFIVDWLLPVNTWLDKFAINPLKGEIKISDFMWSYKWIAQWDLSLNFGTEGTNHGEWFPRTNGKPLGYIRSKRYFRDIGLPIIPSELSAPELSNYQQALGSTLLYNNISGKH